MNAAQLGLRQLRFEQRIFWRTPATVFFTVAMPLTLLVIFASINRDQRLSAVGGVRFADYFVPGMAAFGVAATCYGNVAARIVFRREAGLLRRARTTPLPTTSLLAGYIANAATTSALSVTAVTITGIIFFGLPVPSHLPLLVLSVMLGAASLSALGLAVSTYIPSIEAADAVVFGTLLPVLFISGAFQPVASDSIIGRISVVLPIRHLLELNLAAYGIVDDHKLWRHIAALVAWGTIGASIAARRFKWQPRAT